MLSVDSSMNSMNAFLLRILARLSITWQTLLVAWKTRTAELVIKQMKIFFAVLLILLWPREEKWLQNTSIRLDENVGVGQNIFNPGDLCSV